ncbi:MAG: right-handed parallel beta-helix repeat-containing protein [Anaerobutyricum hallii]
MCANFAGAGNESKYRKARNYHSNITIENCNVTGISAEAIALFNTKSATVKNCRITTKTPKSRNSYSVGLAVAYQKGSAPKATTKTKNVISLTNNTVKGGQQGIFVRSNASKKLGTVIVSGNTVSAKKGKKNAIKVLSAKKVKIAKNKTKKW